MWNKTGRRQRTWGDMAQHRDHRERDGWRRPAPWGQGCQEERGRDRNLSLPVTQQQAQRAWARGDKGSHQSSYCGWEPPETEEEGARETPKRLQGSTLQAKPTLAASFLPLLTEVRETEGGRSRAGRTQGSWGGGSSSQEMQWRTSLGVQWLRDHAPNTGGVGSIPGQGTKTSYAVWHPPKKNQKENAMASTEKGL